MSKIPAPAPLEINVAAMDNNQKGAWMKLVQLEGRFHALTQDMGDSPKLKEARKNMRAAMQSIVDAFTPPDAA